MNAVGIDLGGTNLRAARVTPAGIVQEQVSRPLADPADKEAILSALKEAARAVLGVGKAKVVGVGAAGPLDPERGVMFSPPNLPGLEDTALADALEAELRLPVFLENDANAAVFGEHKAGAGRGTDVLLGLTLGTGVGGGIVLAGEIFHGPDGSAGELGHLIVDPDGIECACGNRGCLEMYASATATALRFRRGVEAGKTTLPEGFSNPLDQRSAADVHALALKGSAFAREVLAETGRWLGVAIVSLIHVFNPDKVVLLGGLAGAWDFFHPALEAEIQDRALSPSKERVRVVPGALGGDAGVIGAALAALQRVKEQ